MDKNHLAAQAASTAAALLRDAQVNGFKFPRGTTANVAAVLTNGVEGVGKRDRTKYRDGTFAALLDELASALAAA